LEPKQSTHGGLIRVVVGLFSVTFLGDLNIIVMIEFVLHINVAMFRDADLKVFVYK